MNGGKPEKSSFPTGPDQFPLWMAETLIGGTCRSAHQTWCPGIDPSPGTAYVRLWCPVVVRERVFGMGG